mgnify:CR=1 FL=1
MRNTTLRLILIILISVLIGYYVGVNKVAIDWKNYKPSVSITNREPPPILANTDFSVFWNVWEKLEENFYDKSKLDAQKMLNGAIAGLTQSLGDPYTVYLPPVQNNNFKQGLAGEFSGIGAELGMVDEQVIVIAPLNGSPAERAGVKAQDAIVKVDGASTLGWNVSQAVEKIRGPKGTEVVLSVIHKNTKKSENVKITRDTITIKSVEGWIKDIKSITGITSTTGIKGRENEKVAYIRLSQFGDQTNKEWTSLVNNLDLQIQQDKSVKGLILDLRNNPGGYLTDAVFIASEFLGVGKTVVLEEGHDNKRNFSVTRKGYFTKIPLIILINKGSASASEIVAAAMIDNNRAILIGDTSFGKGTIQMADDLGNGAGLHITIAKWLTPKGVWVNGKGLKPDIEVKLDEKSKDRDTQLERAVEELLK